MARITKDTRILKLQEEIGRLNTYCEDLESNLTRLSNKLEIIKRLHRAITEEFKE